MSVSTNVPMPVVFFLQADGYMIDWDDQPDCPHCPEGEWTLIVSHAVPTGPKGDIEYIVRECGYEPIEARYLYARPGTGDRVYSIRFREER